MAATGYNIYDDIHNHGWNPVEAVVADSASTLAGVGAAAGVVALAPEAAPAIVVAGAGVAVAYEATEAMAGHVDRYPKRSRSTPCSGRCPDLVEPFRPQSAAVGELVVSVPAPRCDQCQHEDSAVAQ